jgi:hypothetical protein
MSPALIAITGLIYLVVAADLALHGKVGLAVAYLGYSFANVGLYLAARAS